MKKKFIILSNRTNYLDEENISNLRNNPSLAHLTPLMLDILYNRGYKNEKDILNFLNLKLENIYPSHLLEDSEKFVEVVSNSIKNKDQIVCYTDYDVDGICSAAALCLGIKNAGGIIDYYTNNRFIEGYGITKNGVKDLVEKYPSVKLIITTDNGIVGFEGIEYAKSIGIDVFVTDHHEQGEILPNALGVVNPKRKDCKYPFKGLCGAGVVFKLLIQLYWDMNLNLDYVYDLLDIISLATVGDLVPLIDENRIIVKEGLKRVKAENRLVFKKLREGLGLTKIDEETFGFVYGPILNALGRIDGSPDTAIELFLTDDEKKMELIIEELSLINEKRKELTKQQENLAFSLLEDKEIPNVIVLYHKDFHEGVVGLVAGRIKEAFNRPTIVLAPHTKEIEIDGKKEIINIYKGSARSIEGFHLKESFDKLKDLILGYGGHKMAAGLSLREDMVEKFIDEINTLAKYTLTEDDYVKKIEVDSLISANELDFSIIEDIEMLKPFGMEFSKPKFALKNFEVDSNKTNSPYIGSDSSHLKLINKNNVSLIMFKHSQRYKLLKEPNVVKAVGTPSINVFRGVSNIQFLVDGDNIFKNN